MGAVGVDPGRDLDHRVVGQAGQGPVVADVDHLGVAGAGVEGGDEGGRGLAVEGPAAPLQQLRLGVEGRVAVQLQQPPLDPGHLLGPRGAAPLLVQHLGGGVVVAQVGRGDGPEVLEQRQRQAQVGGQLAAVALQQRSQPVGPVDPDGPLPGQVVEADVLELDPPGGHAQQGGEAALEADGRVAQPDGAVAVVEQGLGDDADRVGEVDEPGAGGGAAGGLISQLEHHRDGAQGLGEAARPGRLLADAAELQRQGLVHQPHGLAADAQLHDHEVGAVDGVLAPAGLAQAAAPAGPGQHAPGQAAHHREALGVDVEQHQLVDREPVGPGGQALDQLRGVGAAAPDHRDLQAHARPLSLALGWLLWCSHHE